MKVGFLYNHDALHQIRHTAPVAAALAQFPNVEVVILTSSASQETEVRSLVAAAAGSLRFERLSPGILATVLDAMLRFVAPFRRVAVLRRNLSLFAQLDALVVPETTSLLLRDRFGLRDLRFIWIPHGAGDRSVGFRPVVKGFDLVLVAGEKIRDRMLESGVVTQESCRIVGYPKFDTVDPKAPLPSLFDNGQPTVLYNPHFDPRLSSWYSMGTSVLDWFADQDRFNLVFAPHVMLFQRRLHASVEHRKIRWRAHLDERYGKLPHMRIDTGSQRSTDMTYTRSADIYLGDASSQIYEWIGRPRPAIFLNPDGLAWKGDPNFAHWNLGEVVDSMVSLEQALDTAVAAPDRWRQAQELAFNSTFSVEPVPASRRAAAAIVQLLQPGQGKAPGYDGLRSAD